MVLQRQNGLHPQALSDAIRSITIGKTASRRFIGGYRNLNYLLLKAQRLAATRTQLVALQKAA
jgi:hypothetical protein